MSRTSRDEYKTIDGKRVLWNGYDYDRQYWVHEGKRDTRTLEELRQAQHARAGTFYHHSDRGADLSNDADAIAEHVQAGKRAQSFINTLCNS